MSNKTYSLELKSTQKLIDWIDKNLPKGTRFADYLWKNVIKTDNPDLELIKFLFQYRDIVRQDTGKKYVDLFGDYMCHAKNKMDTDHFAQFLTPNSVCELMTGITMPELQVEGLLKMDEPTCGTGKIPLSVFEWLSKNPNKINRVFYTCTDLDFEAFVYCLMNMFLHQIPNVVVMQGNSLLGKQEDLYIAVETYLTKEGYVEWRECREVAKLLPQWNY